jgi:methionyl aminopeptidase
MIKIKSDADIHAMRLSGKILASVMNRLVEKARVGISTKELDDLAYNLIIKEGACPSFLNYNGFPASICASINEELVHGIPSQRVLCNGDILSIDAGVEFLGFHTDMAVTIPIGNVDKKSLDLIEVTRLSLYRAIEQCVIGNTLGDIGYAVESFAQENGYSVVRDYVGHGIGQNLHEDPQVPNFGVPKSGIILAKGMTLAIEPMINMGKYKVKTLKDNWTVVTKDKKRCAHFEHTVYISDNGPEILTKIK